MRKFKNRCGAALLEVLISIAILGLLTVPISSGIMMSLHINANSDEIMQAKLAVSSAAEMIMAEGIWIGAICAPCISERGMWILMPFSPLPDSKTIRGILRWRLPLLTGTARSTLRR